jgi:hypothetical protein
MVESVPIDMRDITVTPVFRYETIEDINASEREGHLVKRVRQVVEVRFAGSRNYSPVFPVDAFWRRQNGRVVTYAERWADRYREFLAGASQEASGTPLEMLRGYGISDSQLSLCKALRIYSIEALFHLEGDALKSLQMAGNDLKVMARKYMADRQSKSGAVDEIADLKAQIAALKAGSPLPEQDSTPTQIEQAIADSDAEYANLSDTELKEKIAQFNDGNKPKGNPSRATLVSMLGELEGAA